MYHTAEQQINSDPSGVFSYFTYIKRNTHQGPHSNIYGIDKPATAGKIRNNTHNNNEKK